MNLPHENLRSVFTYFSDYLPDYSSIKFFDLRNQVIPFQSEVEEGFKIEWLGKGGYNGTNRGIG